MASRAIWQIEVRHNGLNKYRLIRGSDRHVVEQKALAQKAAWDEMWIKKQEVEERKRTREAAIKSKEEKKSHALDQTKEAERRIEALESTLSHTLSVDDAVDWESLIDQAPFPHAQPPKPTYEKVPTEPRLTDSAYQPKINLIDRIFKKQREKKELQAASLYTLAHDNWVREKQAIDRKNDTIEDKYKEAISVWNKAKHNYEIRLASKNKKIIEQKNLYLNKDPGAISDYCELVLSNSVYPENFPQEWDIDYNKDSKLLIVDYSLPNIDTIPAVKSVKYIASRDEFVVSQLSDPQINRLYDTVLYQIALRTIHELYEADVVNALNMIIFNGWVKSTDKSTGLTVNPCIISLQASKDEFLAINLANIDPKACFKHLKGVGSSKLHGLAPIAPIASINKEDRRFVNPYDVVDTVDSSNNLAAMDWKDFENLIREIFEKEFSKNGGEVKITQASRDGGVDAIAFDPDPIRGGKIVIQAKRYTNTVGVSAVRDLYGTILNEGATKGILVTTAEYGPDAYKFAQGKPLTLLNGSNLLHLLAKHGHQAKIDLKEAKELIGNN